MRFVYLNEIGNTRVCLLVQLYDVFQVHTLHIFNWAQIAIGQNATLPLKSLVSIKVPLWSTEPPVSTIHFIIYQINRQLDYYSR